MKETDILIQQAEEKQNQLRELLGRLREERGALEEENMRLKQAALHQDERRDHEDGGRMSGAAFTQNVRKFLSENGEVPMMQSAYDEMTPDEKSSRVRCVLLCELVKSAHWSAFSEDITTSAPVYSASHT